MLEKIKTNYLIKVAIGILFIWVVGAIIISFIEGGAFQNIGNSLWWTIVTMTTVGYGDITPQTELGQALASLAMIFGYATIAIPTGIISAEYTTMKQTINNIVCRGCGDENHENDAKFCRVCGADLE